MSWGLYDTFLGMILFYIAICIPFCTFIFRNYFLTLPGEVLEAAKLDGCSNLKAYWKIFMPLSKPAIAVLLLFQFTWVWNDLMFGMVLTRSTEVRPIMVGLAQWNKNILDNHLIFATGTTGKLLIDRVGLKVHCLKSGPLGGDLQIGAKIVEGEIDVLIFFWDPLKPQPHDVDVKALLRIAVVYNIPTACNRSSADYLVSSVLLYSQYQPLLKTC
jgi:methylglyoxal synthase